MLKPGIYLVLSIAIAVSGVFAFSGFGVNGNFLLLAIGMLAIVMGGIMSAMFISTLLFPKTIPLILADKGKETYKLLKTVIGRRKRKWFYITWVFFMLTNVLGALVIALYLFESNIGKELQQYGKVIKVEISDTHYRKSRKVDFSFVHANTLYTSSLPSNILEIGDSVEVIYSTRHPDLVRWADEEY